MLRSEWFNTDAVIELAWTQAWQVAAVAVLIAVVTAIFCRHRPHLAYLLWMLVLVKAVTPPLWSSPTGAFSWALAESVRVVSPAAAPLTPPAPSPPAIEFSESDRPAQVPADPMSMLRNPPVVEAPPSGGLALTLNDALLIAWATGVIGLGGWLTVNWLLLARRIRRMTGSPAPELAGQFTEVKRRIGVRRPVRLLITSESLGPAALGWWRGTVLVPDSVIERSTPTELDAIFAHELVHLRRFDPLVGTLQLAVQCVWWWHPAIWWANRQVRIERERSCDEAVLAQVDVRPTDYAKLLVELLRSRRAPVPAVFWSGMRSTSATTARVRHVLETKTFRRRSPLAAWLIAALALAIVLPGAGSRFITAAPPKPAQQTQPDVAVQAVAPTADATNLIDLWKQHGTFGTLTDDERACVLELEQLGVECFLSDYGPPVPSFSTSGRGQLHFDMPPIPQGTLKTFVHIYLPPDLVPSRSLPLDRLPSLLIVQVGGGHFFTPSIPDWGSQPPPSEDQLRSQLKSLVNMTSAATLNIIYTKENAEALRVLPTLPKLERLALWSTFASVPSDKFQFHLDALRLKALSWSSEGNAPTRFDNRLPEIAKIWTLEQLLLTGTMDANALDQLSTLGRLRTLLVTRHWPMPKLPPPLKLTALSGMPNLEELYIDVFGDDGARHIGRLTKLQSFSAMPAALSDVGLDELVKASQLRSLRMSGPLVISRLTPQGMTALGQLTQLESLHLTNWGDSAKGVRSITDESIAAWNGLVKLEELNVSAAEIGDASLRVLGGLPEMRSIQLHGVLNVTDDGLAPLAGLSRLEMLILPDSQITGPGVGALTGMARLQTVSLARAPLEDSGMTELAKINSLRQLDISRTKITDGGLADFAGKLPLLTRLNLAETNISDEGAAALLNRPQLQEVDVTGTNLTVRFLNQLAEGNWMLRVWSQPASRSGMGGMGGMNSGGFQPVEWRHFPAAEETAVKKTAADVKTEKAGKGASEPEEVTFALAPAAASDEVAESKKSAVEKPAPAGARHEAQDAIDRLTKLGLRVTPIDVGGQQKLYADFDKNFQPLVEPLPLAELPKLEQIAIGDRRDLSEEQLAARLRAVRNLRPETNLIAFFGPDQGAAFDLLAEIPNLQRLHVIAELPPMGGKTGRKITLSQLKNVRELSLLGTFTDASLTELAPLEQLEMLQLYQEKPFAKLDLACLENKSRLRRFITGGIEPTDEGFARIGKLPALEQLMTNFTSATDAGMSELAKLGNLKTLMLDSSQEPSRVTPEGMLEIGKLTKLVNLTLGGKFGSGNAAGEGAVDDRLIASWSPHLKQLKMLNLFNCTLTDAGLSELSKLSLLVRLNLSGELQITDQGLTHLGTMTTLRHLSLSNAAITDEGLSRLKALTSMESLVLYNAPQSQISDEGLARLAGFSKLEKLVITNAKIEGRGLAPFTTLTSLSLENNPVDDAGVEILVRNNQLTDLNLSGTKINDKAFKFIGANLSNLKRLSVRQTQLTDAGLEALKPLKHLREVRAAGTQITQAGKDSLKSVVDFGNDWTVTGEFEVFSLEVD